MHRLIDFLRSERFFLRFATITLVSLYLVILAGSVVRASGSGMGCPDWPKCFGFYIPPTSPAQVHFQPNESYHKGRLIIANDTLWRAKQDFIASTQFEYKNWEVYPNHNYAKFFVSQTWIEYINRLLGALSALATTILLLLSLFRVRKDWLTTALLVLGIFVLAFVGWLGKVVVDSNLKPLTISMHMFSAMAMVAIVLFVQQRIRKRIDPTATTCITKGLRFALIISLVLTIAQILAGIQVRQQIDEIYKVSTDVSRNSWIGQLDGRYLTHQVMAVFILLYTIAFTYFFQKQKPTGTVRRLSFIILFLILAEYGIGVFLHNFSIPAYAQPLHLILVHILFGVQLALLVRTTSRTNA